MNQGSQRQPYQEEITLGLLSSAVGNQRRMVLLPFEEGSLPMAAVESAVELAESAAAELVLLCVRPPMMAGLSTQADEHLFSDLKSLQAQLQAFDMPVRIEMVVGPIAQFIRDKGQDLPGEPILIPGYPTGERRRIRA